MAFSSAPLKRNMTGRFSGSDCLDKISKTSSATATLTPLSLAPLNWDKCHYCSHTKINLILQPGLPVTESKCAFTKRASALDPVPLIDGPILMTTFANLSYIVLTPSIAFLGVITPDGLCKSISIWWTGWAKCLMTASSRVRRSTALTSFS